MRIIFCALLVTLAINAWAATVDTISIYSNAMHKDIKCVVIKPDTYKKKKNIYPVVYLLHGHGGWYSNWIIRVPQLKDHADRFQLLIVCPDGAPASWYLDSPIDSTMRYETHVAKEIPGYIDAHYRTIKNRASRAISGLSMGGHGAFFLAFRHSDIFGACGSMSGVMNLYSSRNSYDIVRRIGDTTKQADNWKNYSVSYAVEKKPSDSLAIIFDCGLSDPFFPDNKKLHEKMLSLKIAHDYIERPGSHSWTYWASSIEYHFMFFRKYFDAMKPVAAN
jgi:S-formylglutathione hydrolase FrmB